MGWAFIQSDSSWDDDDLTPTVSEPNIVNPRKQRRRRADNQVDDSMLSACKFSDADIRAEYGITNDESDVTRKTWKMKFVKCWKMYRDARFPHIQDDTTVELNTAFSYYLKKKAPFPTTSSNLHRRKQSQQQQIPVEVERFFNKAVTLSYDQSPLDWWKANEKAYPVCAAMARDILAIPASSAEPERVHSQARTVLNWNQSRMGHYTVLASVLIKYALIFNKGYGQVMEDQLRKLEDQSIAFELSK